MKKNRWLMVLIVFMLVSILWSNMPYVSFKRWTREFLAILMAFAVLSEPSPRQAIESILRRMAYILIPFSLLLIKYFRDYGILYTRDWDTMWIGVTLHKNSLGQLCVIVIFFLFWSLIKKWKKRVVLVWKYEIFAELLVLAIALWLLRGPAGTQYSATAISALATSLLVYAGLKILRKYGNDLGIKILSILVAVIIIVGIVAVFTGGSSVRFIVSSAGRDETLTGRTEIWATLLPFAMQKPLLGGGYGGFWTTSRRNAIAQHAHSGYLEVLLGLGFVGILLVSIFLLSSCKKAQLELSDDFDWGTLWVGFLIMLVVHSITESSIQDFTAPLTAIVLLFTVSSCKASPEN